MREFVVQKATDAQSTRNVMCITTRLPSASAFLPPAHCWEEQVGIAHGPAAFPAPIYSGTCTALKIQHGRILWKGTKSLWGETPSAEPVCHGSVWQSCSLGAFLALGIVKVWFCL